MKIVDLGNSMQKGQENFKYYRSVSRKLLLSTHESNILIDVDEIGYLCAEGSYCRIFLLDGRHIICSKPMSWYFNKLEQVGHFVRVHHGYVVNIDQVSELHHEKGILLKQFSVSLPVSRRKKGIIKKLLESISL